MIDTLFSFPHNYSTFVDNTSPGGTAITSFVDMDLYEDIYFGNNTGPSFMVCHKRLLNDYVMS